MKKIVPIILSIILVATTFAGCGNKNERIDLIYPFGGKVNSYDPQVASTSDEYLIIENCFEGLVRSDDEGKITPACATDWSISSDGLTYTFNIQKGLKWYVFKSTQEKMGEDYSPEVTAHDFVFALQRAVDKNTNSPLYSTVSGIVNAPQVHGGFKDASALGVSAIDDYTLQINLSAPDDGFLQTLSTSVAMPCNKEFFESTKGRYGLDLKYTLFNGQFIVTNVLENSYILKKRGDKNKYLGPNPTAVSDITLKIVDGDTSLSSDLISGYYDAAYLRGYESESASKKKGINLIPYSNITWAFVLNSNKGILSYPNARHAFSLALSEIDYKDYSYLAKAKGIVPPTCTVNDKPFTEQASDVTNGLDQDKAVSLWKTAVKGSSTYSAELTVLVPENMKDVAKELLQGVQKSICAISSVNEKKTSFSLKIETMPESKLKSAVYSGNYDIALYPFEATTASPISFLESFSAVNLTSFDSNAFDRALYRAQAESADKLVSACQKSEKELIDSFCYVPLFYESNYYATAKGVSNVQFHPGTGRVSFVNATRKK